MQKTVRVKDCHQAAFQQKHNLQVMFTCEFGNLCLDIGQGEVKRNKGSTRCTDLFTDINLNRYSKCYAVSMRYASQLISYVLLCGSVRTVPSIRQ